MPAAEAHIFRRCENSYMSARDPLRQAETQAGCRAGAPWLYEAQIGLEYPARATYSPLMDDTPHRIEAPTEWAEALARSDAEFAAGQTVPAEAVHERIRNAIARIEAKRAARLRRKSASGVDCIHAGSGTAG